jgi:outer membrane assembly lipoprotein YfiO
MFPQIFHHAFTASVIATAIFVTSCSDIDEVPPLLGSVQVDSSAAAKRFQDAKSADTAGKSKKAASLYKKAADRYPTAKHAPEARFRYAQLQEQLGKPLEAFTAYSEVVKRYRSSGLYEKALQREHAIAEDALSGRIKSGFLFSSKLDPSELIKILETVRDSAPQATTAPRAQFRIGEIYQKERKSKEAIDAFRKVAEEYPDAQQADEAQFRIGNILLDEALRGNQDKGNLDRAREAFEDYLNRYSGKPRTAEVKQQIAALKNQDVQRSYEVAEFYRRKGDLESAKFYYREVLKQHGSGDLHNQAQSRLKEIP